VGSDEEVEVLTQTSSDVQRGEEDNARELQPQMDTLGTALKPTPAPGEAASSDSSTSRVQISSLEAEAARLQSGLGEAENPAPGLEYTVVMSGNHLECGICFEEFDARHMFWPCQHARQCGDCASRVWKTPAKRRRCPWCAAKIDSRPRPLKPYV
jgi:hypothetical protein